MYAFKLVLLFVILCFLGLGIGVNAQTPIVTSTPIPASSIVAGLPTPTAGSTPLGLTINCYDTNMSGATVACGHDSTGSLFVPTGDVVSFAFAPMISYEYVDGNFVTVTTQPTVPSSMHFKINGQDFLFTTTIPSSFIADTFGKAWDITVNSVLSPGYYSNELTVKAE